jgi:hypothetical protein
MIRRTATRAAAAVVVVAGLLGAKETLALEPAAARLDY